MQKLNNLKVLSQVRLKTRRLIYRIYEELSQKHLKYLCNKIQLKKRNKVRKKKNLSKNQ